MATRHTRVLPERIERPHICETFELVLKSQYFYEPSNLSGNLGQTHMIPDSFCIEFLTQSDTEIF